MNKKSFASIFFAVISLVAIGFVSFQAWKEARRNRQIENEISTIRSEAEKIRRNNQELGDRIAYFETPEFQEKVAKDKLDFQKPDEEVVIIKSSPAAEKVKTKASPLLPAGNEEVAVPNYQRWWNYFFKY